MRTWRKRLPKQIVTGIAEGFRPYHWYRVRVGYSLVYYRDAYGHMLVFRKPQKDTRDGECLIVGEFHSASHLAERFTRRLMTDYTMLECINDNPS